MGIRQVPVKGGSWFLLEYEVCLMHGSRTPRFRYLIDYQVIIFKRPNAMLLILPLSRSPCFTYTHECQQVNANPPCAIPALEKDLVWSYHYHLSPCLPSSAKSGLWQRDGKNNVCEESCLNRAVLGNVLRGSNLRECDWFRQNML